MKFVLGEFLCFVVAVVVRFFWGCVFVLIGIGKMG